MDEIQWTITEEDIEWRFQMSEPPCDKMIFEPSKAVAHLILNEIISIHTGALIVNCSDVFAWACGDAEPLPFSQIENLYRMWRKDPEFGAEVWCMIQRKQMPQKPVESKIRAAGIWDLDALGLKPNTRDAEVHALMASLPR